eukprot:366126-Chlamydomonas_euryale.AAC.11
MHGVSSLIVLCRRWCQRGQQGDIILPSPVEDPISRSGSVVADDTVGVGDVNGNCDGHGEDVSVTGASGTSACGRAQAAKHSEILSKHFIRSLISCGSSAGSADRAFSIFEKACIMCITFCDTNWDPVLNETCRDAPLVFQQWKVLTALGLRDGLDELRLHTLGRRLRVRQRRSRWTQPAQPPACARRRCVTQPPTPRRRNRSGDTGGRRLRTTGRQWTSGCPWSGSCAAPSAAASAAEGDVRPLPSAAAAAGLQAGTTHEAGGSGDARTSAKRSRASRALPYSESYSRPSAGHAK